MHYRPAAIAIPSAWAPWPSTGRRRPVATGRNAGAESEKGRQTYPCLLTRDWVSTSIAILRLFMIMIYVDSFIIMHLYLLIWSNVYCM